MRILIALFAATLFSSVAAAQVVPASVGYDGCGAPYIPRLTTPEVSLQTVSAAPVGATNATYGLTAGATNGTLSNVTGNTGGTYTQPVWYAGGTTPPIIRTNLPGAYSVAPSLVYDPNGGEDIDQNCSSDHCFDCLRYALTYKKTWFQRAKVKFAH